MPLPTPSHWHARELEASTTPLLTVVFLKCERELRFFSMRIECSFPADAATGHACRDLAGAAVER
jgi:hypothetical protein